MADLDRLVRDITRRLYAAAFEVYTPTEIARALGTSRQAISQQRQRRKRAGPPADPPRETPSTEGTSQ